MSRLWEEVQHGGAARLPREGVCSMSTSQVTYLYFYLYFCLYLYLYFHEKGCVEGRLTLNQDCLSSLHNLIYCLVFISLVWLLVKLDHLVVLSRSPNNGMFRCEFCGQGFIVAARLKHHRRNCQVLINKLLKSSKSQYNRIIIVCNPIGKSGTNDSCLQGGLTFGHIYIYRSVFSSGLLTEFP